MQKAWILTAEMGYGHKRAVYPFKEIGVEGVCEIGNPPATPPAEKRLWAKVLWAYEFLSRIKKFPLIGETLFKIVDSFLAIPPLYPLERRTAPSIQVRILDRFIRLGLCHGLISNIRKNPHPILTSFYAPAVAADRMGFDPIYCIICDADVSRAWVAPDPEKSKIRYFAPCGRVSKRLRSYGVPRSHIHLTGFPLPDGLVGGKTMTTLKENLGQRLHYLDPRNRFFSSHQFSVEKFLGSCACRFRNDRKLTITYAVGGAGAQMDIGLDIAHSFRDLIRADRICLNLVAGARPAVAKEFTAFKQANFPRCPSLRVISADSFEEYYSLFNAILHETDILWTKPSEISFYCGLGLPIIMSPSIGAQERHNRRWLFEIQAGMDQEDPRYAHEWLLDRLKYGRFADMAWSGFLKVRKQGTIQIKELLAGNDPNSDDFPR